MGARVWGVPSLTVVDVRCVHSLKALVTECLHEEPGVVPFPGGNTAPLLPNLSVRGTYFSKVVIADTL